jgi:hypothetical protein
VVLGVVTLALALPAPDAALVTGLAGIVAVLVGTLLSARDAHRALG